MTPFPVTISEGSLSAMIPARHLRSQATRTLVPRVLLLGTTTRRLRAAPPTEALHLVDIPLEDVSGVETACGHFYERNPPSPVRVRPRRFQDGLLVFDELVDSNPSQGVRLPVLVA